MNQRFRDKPTDEPITIHELSLLFFCAGRELSRAYVERVCGMTRCNVSMNCCKTIVRELVRMVHQHTFVVPKFIKKTCDSIFHIQEPHLYQIIAGFYLESVIKRFCRWVREREFLYSCVLVPVYPQIVIRNSPRRKKYILN